MYTHLQNDTLFINEVLKSGVEGLFLLERGYSDNEVIEILQTFKHRQYLEKEVATMNLHEREVFYTWHCGQYREDILTV